MLKFLDGGSQVAKINKIEIATTKTALLLSQDMGHMLQHMLVSVCARACAHSHFG